MLKLEVGKTYKTRSGEKVKVVHKKTHSMREFGVWIVSNDMSLHLYTVHNDGRFYREQEIYTNDDLIAEDIPTRTYYRAAVYRSKEHNYYASSDLWEPSKAKFEDDFNADVLEWETRELPDLGEE